MLWARVVSFSAIAIVGAAQDTSLLAATDLFQPRALEAPDGDLYLIGTQGTQDEDVQIEVRRLADEGRTTRFVLRFGGSEWDAFRDAAVGKDGSLYLLATTGSEDFPTTPGALEPTMPLDSSSASALVKVSGEGELLASTFLLAAESFRGFALAMTSGGDLVVSGVSDRPDFAATPGAFDFRDPVAPFVWATLRLSGDLREALWTAVGAGGAHVAVDQADDVYVLGTSGPFDYPVTPGAFQGRPALSICGGFLGVPCARQRISKLSRDGTALVYSTFVTGGRGEFPAGLAVDDAGRAYIAGTTMSQDYPTTEGAFERENPSRLPTFRAPRETAGYATLISADGSTLVYSTYFGGAGGTEVRALALAPEGGLLAAGMTTSADFPAAPDWPARCLPLDLDRNLSPVVSIPWPGRREQSFLTQISPDGSSISGSQLLVGRRNGATGLLPRANGTTWLTGTTELRDIPLSPGYQHAAVAEGGSTAYLAAFDAGSDRHPTSLGCLTEPADLRMTQAVSPTQVLTLFAARLGTPEPTSPSGERDLPRSVAGVEALFDGTAAPLLFANENQLNLVAPRFLASQTSTTLELRVRGETVARREYAVLDRTPHVFIDPDLGDAACSNETGGFGTAFPLGRFVMEDGLLNECGAFARPGSGSALFLNGLGLAPGLPPEGTLASTAQPLGLPVEVSINGQPATVEYAGTAPGQAAGVWQVNARLPPAFDPAIFFDQDFAAVAVVVRIEGEEAQPGPMTMWVSR